MVPPRSRVPADGRKAMPPDDIREHASRAISPPDPEPIQVSDAAGHAGTTARPGVAGQLDGTRVLPGPVAEKPSEWSHDAGRRHLARVRWSRRVLDKPSNSRKTIIRCHWFAAWQIEHIQRAAVPSDTCMLKVILARLSATSPPRRQIDLICAPRSGGAKYPATRTERRLRAPVSGRPAAIRYDCGLRTVGRKTVAPPEGQQARKRGPCR